MRVRQTEGAGRFGALRALAGAMALGWLLFVWLALWPAWQARANTLTALSDRERELADRQTITASLPITRARLEEHRLTVAHMEAPLPEAAADTDVIRLIEALTGSAVAVETIQTGERSALQTVEPAAAASSASAVPETHYWQTSCRIEARGAWEPLRSFLAALEREVPGLRLKAIQFQGAPGEWRLVANGSLFMVAAEP